MILEERQIEVEKSSNFESTEFRIDGKYKNKVLWMLINQYRHKVRTPVQEIISNARDAQRENGNPEKPIKIQLPTKIEPTFIVRDYGVGMDENRIKTIFTSFGASTKNADNAQTGGFGIGAKSPLAYTDSFNIKTYVNGQYWFYVIAKTENEGIGINLLSTGDTTEENGTEVQIPVKYGDNREFIESACRCTMFWDVLPSFNLGEEDVYKVVGGTKISDTLTVYNRSDLGGILSGDLFVLVDGIPYVVDYETKRKVENLNNITSMLNYGGVAVFKLNTGDIDLLQTRESIEETEKTLDKLGKMAFKGHSDLNLYVESFITEKSLEGVFKQYNDVSKKFRNVKRYNFENVISIVQNSFSIKRELNTVMYSFQSKARSRSMVSTPQRHVAKKDFNKTDIFYYDDIKDAESDILKNRRMKKHLNDTKIPVCLIYQGEASNFEYMRTLRLLKAKKLSSLALPEKKKVVRNSSGKVVKKLPENVSLYFMRAGSYSAYKDSNSRTFKIADIEQTHVYVEFSENGGYMNNVKYINMLKNEYNVVPCKLSLKDIKNVKDCDMFIHINDYIKTIKPTKNMISRVIFDYVKAIAVIPSSDKVKFITKNNKKITNKELTKLAQCVTINRGDYSSRLPDEIVEKIEKKYKEIIEKLGENCTKFNDLMDNKYPLINLTVNDNENIFYINSKEK